MAKLDFKKLYKDLYSPSAKRPALVEVPDMDFLMIDGRGDPNTAQEFQQAMEALYGVFYTVKFARKRAGAKDDYVVPPPEGLWWMEGLTEFGPRMAELMRKKDQWKWTLMIARPPQVTAELVQKAISDLTNKKDLPALKKIRLEAFHEGLSAQILHVGPYCDEPPTIAALQVFIAEQSCRPRGKHHEIYLSDPRRTAPAKLKTILRQPVERGS